MRHHATNLLPLPQNCDNCRGQKPHLRGRV